MKRVVSLIASSTEIVCALGCREWLVGRSHECDFPADVADLPVCTEAKILVEGTSAKQIDEQVKDAVRDALSVYRVDAAMLQELAPDVILTQSQCEVCAVSLKDVEEAVCELVGSRPEIVALEPNALADVWEDIRRVARALGIVERGEALIADLKSRMEEIAGRASSIATTDRPRIACIEWQDPLMAAGNWVPELVDMAAGANLFGEAGKHSPWMTWEQLRESEPDLIVVMPCGFDIARTREEMPAMTKLPGWGALRAVRDGKVFLADGNPYFNRPGPRLAESLEILAELLHPDVFSFGHEGGGWVRFTS